MLPRLPRKLRPMHRQRHRFLTDNPHMRFGELSLRSKGRGKPELVDEDETGGADDAVEGEEEDGGPDPDFHPVFDRCQRVTLICERGAHTSASESSIRPYTDCPDSNQLHIVVSVAIHSHRQNDVANQERLVTEIPDDSKGSHGK